jgi:hypothetical protein
MQGNKNNINRFSDTSSYLTKKNNTVYPKAQNRNDLTIRTRDKNNLSDSGEEKKNHNVNQINTLVSEQDKLE